VRRCGGDERGNPNQSPIFVLYCCCVCYCVRVVLWSITFLVRRCAISFVSGHTVGNIKPINLGTIQQASPTKTATGNNTNRECCFLLHPTICRCIYLYRSDHLGLSLNPIVPLDCNSYFRVCRRDRGNSCPVHLRCVHLRPFSTAFLSHQPFLTP